MRRKSKCIKRWLDYYIDNTNNQAINTILETLIYKPTGRFDIVEIVINPFNYKYIYILEIFSKLQLGRQDVLRDLNRDINELLIRIQYTIDLFYKKELTKISNLIKLFNDTNALKVQIVQEII